MSSGLTFALTIVVIIGAINWLVEGLAPGKNLVHSVLKNKDESISGAERAVYILVGLAGVTLLGLKSYCVYNNGWKSCY